jgi:hypothetical protein
LLQPRFCLGFGSRVDVAADLVADGGTPDVPALVTDLEVAQVEEVDAASVQRGVDFVGVAVPGHRRRLGDQALQLSMCLKIGRSAVRPRPWPPLKRQVIGP